MSRKRRDQCTTALETHLFDLRQGLEDLVQYRRQLDRQTFAIQQATYRVEEDRAEDLAKVRRHEGQRIERTLASARDSLAFARNHVQRSRVDAHVDERAHARVRELLDRGLAPATVLEKAQELGDMRMVTALRSELLYWSPGGRQAGKEKGFIDASQTVEATERTLAKLGEGGQRREAKQALQLRALEGAFQQISEVALRGASSGKDRIALGFAIEATKQAVK